MVATDAWAEGLREARAAFPDVMADPRAFEAHAGRCRERGARAEHLPDLLLAWAAGRADPAALRHLDELVAPDVEAAARRVDRAPEFADEVRQALRIRLLVAEGGRARVDGYSGRGPLRGWVGVAALRVALNLRRGAGPATQELLADLVGGEADPELRHLKALYRAEFREALEGALAALPGRDRAILRLTYVDGLRLARLAALYQVHESTASRWVSRAAGRVAEEANRRLLERLSLSPSALESAARMVSGSLDLSLARILGG